METNNKFDYNAYINEQMATIKKEREENIADRKLIDKEKSTLTSAKLKFEAKLKLEYVNFKKENNYYDLIKGELKDIAKLKLKLKNEIFEVDEQKKKFVFKNKKIKEEFDNIDKERDKLEAEKQALQNEFKELMKMRKENDEQILKIQREYKQLVEKRKS